jgi:ribosomal protein S1
MWGLIKGIKDPGEAVKVGQIVKALVLNPDSGTKRITLSHETCCRVPLPDKSSKVRGTALIAD